MTDHETQINQLQNDVAVYRAEAAACHAYIAMGRQIMLELAEAADEAAFDGKVFPKELSDRVGMWGRQNPVAVIAEALPKDMRVVDNEMLHLHGIPVIVNGTARTSAENWALIDEHNLPDCRAAEQAP